LEQIENKFKRRVGTMRAAYLESTGKLVMKDVPMPEITRPDEVLIQVKMVGVCGSEVHAFHGTHPFRLVVNRRVLCRMPTAVILVV